jgi:hypothetical protein
VTIEISDRRHPSRSVWAAVARYEDEYGGRVRDEFVAAALAEQASTRIAEITAVLNRLPPELLRGPDERVVDAVDALMDELYRHGRLVCPGHRWLSGPPSTIRAHLVRLHAAGHLFRDAATGVWGWSECTSFFKVTGG